METQPQLLLSPNHSSLETDQLLFLPPLLHPTQAQQVLSAMLKLMHQLLSPLEISKLLQYQMVLTLARSSIMETQPPLLLLPNHSISETLLHLNQQLKLQIIQLHQKINLVMLKLLPQDQLVHQVLYQLDLTPQVIPSSETTPPTLLPPKKDISVPHHQQSPQMLLQAIHPQLN
jgi:hypothetical protein